MTTPHDQLMKELIAAFPRQFLRLAALEVAERVDLDTVAFEPEEHYPGTPAGRARRPDLVSRAQAKTGEDGAKGEVLLHVEIELRYYNRKLPGLLSYHRGLSLKYALPVHTIVLYLRGGPPGGQVQVHEERSLGRVVATIGYDSLGLSRMPAADCLARPEALAWALAVLMRPAEGQSRPDLGAACLERIKTAPALSRTEREQLLRCLWVYGRFEGHEAQSFDKIMALLDNVEVREMKMSMAEWWKKEGEASLLKRQLRRRFEDLPGWIDQRLEQASPRELETWAERILDAKRLEDVFSPA